MHNASSLLQDQWAEKCESFELNGGDYEEGDGYDGCLDKYDSNPDLGPCPQNDYHDVELAFQENQEDVSKIHLISVNNN